MELPVNPSQMIDLLRAWFFAKDRSIRMADSTTIKFPLGTSINEFSTDGTLDGNSDDAIPTEQAVKTYVDSQGWKLISETTLTGSVASVTFSSIPAIYRTLVFINQARTDVAAEVDVILMRFNADSGNNYDRMIWSFRGDGTTGVAVNRGTSSLYAGNIEAANSRASNFGNAIVFIPNYQLTNREKQITVLSGRFGNVSADADIIWNPTISRWRDTSAITSITLLPNTGPNFVSGSIFALYGIV